MCVPAGAGARGTQKQARSNEGDHDGSGGGSSSTWAETRCQWGRAQPPQKRVQQSQVHQESKTTRFVHISVLKVGHTFFFCLILLLFIYFCVCIYTRLANNQLDISLSENQRRLTSRIGELQNTHERNKMLDEKNGKKTRSYWYLICAVSLFHLLIRRCLRWNYAKL